MDLLRMRVLRRAAPDCSSTRFKVRRVEKLSPPKCCICSRWAMACCISKSLIFSGGSDPNEFRQRSRNCARSSLDNRSSCPFSISDRRLVGFLKARLPPWGKSTIARLSDRSESALHRHALVATCFTITGDGELLPPHRRCGGLPKGQRWRETDHAESERRWAPPTFSLKLAARGIDALHFGRTPLDAGGIIRAGI